MANNQTFDILRKDYKAMYFTSLYGMKDGGEPTAEDLRKTAKYLEEQADKIDKPKLTDEQEAILKYAEDHCIDAIKVSDWRYSTVYTEDWSDLKKGQTAGSWTKLKEVHRFQKCVLRGGRFYNFGFIVHMDIDNDIIVSVEYK